MTPMKALLAGGAVAAMTAFSYAAVSAAPGGTTPGGDEAAAQRPAHSHVMKARGEGGRGHHARDCGARAGGYMERQVNVIEGLMEFTSEQKAAWTELKTAMDAGKETMKKACEARKDQEKPKNAVERFDRFETAMSTRLEIMRSIKPSFEKFYATLSEKQQKAVDGLFARGHRMHRGHRG